VPGATLDTADVAAALGAGDGDAAAGVAGDAIVAGFGSDALAGVDVGTGADGAGLVIGRVGAAGGRGAGLGAGAALPDAVDVVSAAAAVMAR
jgi:hypothetical protein